MGRQNKKKFQKRVELWWVWEPLRHHIALTFRRNNIHRRTRVFTCIITLHHGTLLVLYILAVVPADSATISMYYFTSNNGLSTDSTSVGVVVAVVVVVAQELRYPIGRKFTTPCIRLYVRQNGSGCIYSLQGASPCAPGAPAVYCIFIRFFSLHNLRQQQELYPAKNVLSLLHFT